MNRFFRFSRSDDDRVQTEQVDAELFILTKSALGNKYYDMVVKKWLSKESRTEDPFKIPTQTFKQHMLESIKILTALPSNSKDEAQDIASIFSIAFIDKALAHPELFTTEEVKSMWDQLENIKLKIPVVGTAKACASLYKLYQVKQGKQTYED